LVLVIWLEGIRTCSQVVVSDKLHVLSLFSCGYSG